MKNKSAVLLAFGFLAFLGGLVYAAPGVRGAKANVATATSSSAVFIASGPVTVYSVMLGTGAVTDFAVIYDSASNNGITAGGVSQLAAMGFKLRIYSTSTANTNFVFDPPLLLRNGLVINNATALMTSVVTYERGAVNQGY